MSGMEVLNAFELKDYFIDSIKWNTGVSGDMLSQLSRFTTAKGSRSGLFLGGPTKVKTCNWSHHDERCWKSFSGVFKRLCLCM